MGKLQELKDAAEHQARTVKELEYAQRVAHNAVDSTAKCQRAFIGHRVYLQITPGAAEIRMHGSSSWMTVDGSGPNGDDARLRSDAARLTAAKPLLQNHTQVRGLIHSVEEKNGNLVLHVEGLEATYKVPLRDIRSGYIPLVPGIPSSDFYEAVDSVLGVDPETRRAKLAELGIEEL